MKFATASESNMATSFFYRFYFSRNAAACKKNNMADSMCKFQEEWEYCRDRQVWCTEHMGLRLCQFANTIDKAPYKFL